MTLRQLHGWSAWLVASYAGLHIANHLAGLAGIASHIAFMTAARAIYRLPLVEAVLLCAVTFLIGSGLAFVVRGWKQRQGFLQWLQAGSGAYLLFFFLNHVREIFLARYVAPVDTNFYFAASGFTLPPLRFFFAPYYFLAVLAVFTHLGCALYWQLQARSRRAQMLAVALPTVAGGVIALLIVMSLAGVFYPVQVPPQYQAGHASPP
jgi:hypothetical protein